jgi:hypothetical protein
MVGYRPATGRCARSNTIVSADETRSSLSLAPNPTTGTR